MIRKSCSFGVFFLLSNFGGSATTEDGKIEGGAAGKPCKEALETLVAELKIFKEADNSVNWNNINQKLGSDLTPGVCRGKKIPETTGRQIWELAMGVSEPEFRSLALKRAISFLISALGLEEKNVPSINKNPGISFPDRVCSYHNTPTFTILPETNTGISPLKYSLLLFLEKAKTCLDSLANEAEKKTGKDMFSDDSEEAQGCAREFEQHIRETFEPQKGGALLEKLTSYPGCTQGTKTSGAAPVFHYLTSETMEKVRDSLQEMKSRPDVAAIVAKAILFSHRGFFDSPKDNSRGDFIDYLKLTKLLSDEETRPYGVGNKLCEFTFTTGDQVDTNMLNFVRFLEAKILCGKLTLDDVRDNDLAARIIENDSAAVNANRDASSEEAPLEILSRLSGFTKNLNDYFNALTLAGIPAAEAATRVQVQAALAELALRVNEQLAEIAKMKKDVETKIGLTMDALDEFVGKPVVKKVKEGDDKKGDSGDGDERKGSSMDPSKENEGSTEEEDLGKVDAKDSHNKQIDDIYDAADTAVQEYLARLKWNDKNVMSDMEEAIGKISKFFNAEKAKAIELIPKDTSEYTPAAVEAKFDSRSQQLIKLISDFFETILAMNKEEKKLQEERQRIIGEIEGIETNKGVTRSGFENLKKIIESIFSPQKK